jgi:hypothetical protein
MARAGWAHPAAAAAPGRAWSAHCGKVEDGELRQLFAQLEDQVESGHATDPGIADDEIAHLEAKRELDCRHSVIGVEDGMPFGEKRLDHQANHYLVLVGNDDVPADEAGGTGTHGGDLGPGRHPGVAG